MSRRSRPAATAAALPLLIAPLAAFQLYAFHWGVITPDTVFMWGQALAGRYDDWHPPATTWLWRQLMRLGPGTAPVLAFDVALYWTGVWLVADALRRRGHPRAAIAAMLAAALPIPFGQMGAILKDPLLAACCLAAVGLSLRFGDAGGRARAAAFAAAGGLLAFASATRFNAVFATAPLLALWAPPRWTRGARLGATLAAAAALLAGANWLIDGVLLHPHRSRPIFSLVNFDLAGIAAHGGDGYPALDAAAERAVVARCYDSGQFNPTYREDCDAVEEALRADADARGTSATALWRDAVARAPAAYAAHRLAHLDRNLRFLVAEVPDDAVYVMTTPNRYGIGFTINGATRLVYRAAQAMAASPFGRPATWIAVALGLLIVAPGLRARRFVTAAAASAILYGMAYAAVSVAPDLRYNLWTILAAGAALTAALAEQPWRTARRRCMLAALLPVAAMAAELLAMA